MHHHITAALGRMTVVFSKPETSTVMGADPTVMELVRFHLTPDAKVEDFLLAAQKTEDALRRQPGFLRRALAVDAHGLWVDLVIWTSLEHAKTAAGAMMAEPSFQPFMAMIDMASLELSHPSVLWQMD